MAPPPLLLLRDHGAGARPLFLSPHLDDAVFSCGELIAACARPLVATVFAGTPAWPCATAWDRACGFDDARGAMARRRAEDRAALAALQAGHRHLPFLDCQYGRSPAPGELASAIEALLARARPALAFVPLGLHHDDHRLLADAALLVRGAPPWVAYEELPYSLRQGEVQRRLAALARRGWVATPLAQRGRARQRKRRAALAYRSQCRAFGGAAALAWLDTPERYWSLERRA